MRVEHRQTVINELVLIYNQFPKVSVRIECLWGTQACHDYFNRLLTKDKERFGFPLPVYQRLLSLYLIHTREYTDFDNPILIGCNANACTA
jgi:hypothetical protein